MIRLLLPKNYRNTVLIIGNGISRLSYDKLIKEWKGSEVWGCNFAFVEYGKKLTRLSGHSECLYRAKEERILHGYSYEIWGGNLIDTVKEKEFTCPNEFLKDTGTSWVAQALHEKKKAYCVGFDLGGPDVYSPDHQKFNKSIWITRWRNIIAYYGYKNINFIGYDHLPFLLSNKEEDSYYKQYSKNLPHIEEGRYIKEYNNFDLKKLNFDIEKYFVDIFNFSKRKFVLKVMDKNIDFNPDEQIKMPEHQALYLIKQYPNCFKIFNRS